MYLPLLRGRQYELLALRELLLNDRISDRIIPIIEPVRFSSTLLSVIELFVKKERKIAIIANPMVGEFQESLKNPKINKEKIKEFKELLRNDEIICAYYVDKTLDTSRFNLSRKNLLINTNRDLLDFELDLIEKINPEFILVPEDRLFKKNIKENRILLDDYFNKQEKNSDYMDNDDEFFTDIISAYKEEKHIGFSDYSIVGMEFNEGGFSPKAVAIHIPYIVNDEVRVHHFVSNSNFDVNDPAGKFKEALEKLINWDKSDLL